MNTSLDQHERIRWYSRADIRCDGVLEKRTRTESLSFFFLLKYEILKTQQPRIEVLYLKAVT